jgi:cell surface protein SprA
MRIMSIALMCNHMNVGQNYITDIRNTQVTLPDGSVTEARWMQFKIPVSQPEKQ